MISELLPEEKRRLHELELQVMELERGNGHVQISDVRLGLNEMTGRLEELEKLAAREPKNFREDCKRRVQHLKSSHQHIKSSLDNFVRRRNQNTYDSQRQELLGSAVDVEVGDSESHIAENSALTRSEDMINQYLAIGQNTLQDLMAQKERLKSVQRKVLDILNYLGLSNSIMKAVEKRDVTDKWIVIIGMVIVLALLVWIWWYLKK